jgi:hypothetical protein
VDHEDGIDSVQVEKQAILRPKGQYLGGVPAVAWAQVQKDKSQFSFQGGWGGGGGGMQPWGGWQVTSGMSRLWLGCLPALPACIA